MSETNLHDRYGLSRVINARGTFTPLGVSRSSAQIGNVVAQALGDFFVIDELQARVSEAVAGLTGAEAAAVTHCVSAGITLSVAAAMAGSDPQKVAALPDSRGLSDRVVLPAGHAVDYGHPILTDIRLAGAVPVLAGSESGCTAQDIDAALSHERTACLLLVSSRLVSGPPVDLGAAVAAAHRRGVPAIIDGAAQDLRIGDLLATGADLILISAHKYLGSPTAGLILGRSALVQACRAQERGIGRAMKATKESLLGVLAAIDERRQLDIAAWRRAQQGKVAWFVERANRIGAIRATEVCDPSGMPFPRVSLTVQAAGPDWNASTLAAGLRQGQPPIWVMDHAAKAGQLFLELVPLEQSELQAIIERLAAIVAAQGPGQRRPS